MALAEAFKGRWTVWILSLFFALLAGFGALMILGQASARVNYYVVNQDVAARTVITQDIVDTISAPADSVPPTALDEADIASGELYTKIALKAGTALTTSVVNDNLASLSSEVPEGYVISSLLVKPEDAVGGRIKRGDYVDIAAMNGDDSSASVKIVLQHVYVLDVTVAPDTVAQAAADENTGLAGTGGDSEDQTPGPDSAALYGGIPQLYTFAVSPQDFATLALLRNANVYLAISSAKAPESLDVTVDGSSLFLPGPVAPSTKMSSTSSNTSNNSSSNTQKPTTDPGVEVATFYSDNKANGYTFKVVDDMLIAYDEEGAPVDQIALNGGEFDVETGKYTPAE